MLDITFGTVDCRLPSLADHGQCHPQHMMSFFIARLLKYVEKDLVAQCINISRLHVSQHLAAGGSPFYVKVCGIVCDTPILASARSNPQSEVSHRLDHMCSWARESASLQQNSLFNAHRES